MISTAIANLPAETRRVIQHYAQSLPQCEADRHRAWIGVRARALLSNYWQTSPSEAELEITMGDWIDALDKFTPAEISGACKAWVTDNPSKKPNFGHIAALIQNRRGRIVALHRSRDKSQQIPEAGCSAEPRITPERRAEIMAEVGLSHDSKWLNASQAASTRSAGEKV